MEVVEGTDIMLCTEIKSFSDFFALNCRICHGGYISLNFIIKVISSKNEKDLRYKMDSNEIFVKTKILENIMRLYPSGIGFCELEKEYAKWWVFLLGLHVRVIRMIFGNPSDNSGFRHVAANSANNERQIQSEFYAIYYSSRTVSIEKGGGFPINSNFDLYWPITTCCRFSASSWDRKATGALGYRPALADLPNSLFRCAQFFRRLC